MTMLNSEAVTEHSPGIPMPAAECWAQQERTTASHQAKQRAPGNSAGGKKEKAANRVQVLSAPNEPTAARLGLGTFGTFESLENRSRAKHRGQQRLSVQHLNPSAPSVRAAPAAVWDARNLNAEQCEDGRKPPSWKTSHVQPRARVGPL